MKTKKISKMKTKESTNLEINKLRKKIRKTISENGKQTISQNKEIEKQRINKSLSENTITDIWSVNDECYSRPRFCRLFRAGTTWANEINFVMNHASGAGSIACVVEQLPRVLPLCYGCAQLRQ